MKRVILCASLCALAASAAGAPAPIERQERADPAKIAGQWAIVSHTEWFRDDLSRTKTDHGGIVVISGDSMTIHEGGTRYRHVISVDARQLPCRIDLKMDDTRRVFPGIYRLKGNALVLRVGYNERPTSFGAGQWGDEEYVLRRAR